MLILGRIFRELSGKTLKGCVFDTLVIISTLG